MQITLGKSIIDVDVDATRRSYAFMAKSGPEQCGCSYCRNWAHQRNQSYPQAVVAILSTAGIRVGYETEVWDVQWDDGCRYCSGWYPFVGRILRYSETWWLSRLIDSTWFKGDAHERLNQIPWN